MHLIALIIDVHHPAIPSAEERVICKASFARRQAGHDFNKDHYSLRTYPGTERSRLFTAGMHDCSGFARRSHCCKPHSNPGSSGYVSSSRCLGTRKNCDTGFWRCIRCSSETFFSGRLPILKGSRQRSNHLVEPDGIEPTTSCLQSTRSPN